MGFTGVSLALCVKGVKPVHCSFLPAGYRRTGYRAIGAHPLVQPHMGAPAGAQMHSRRYLFTDSVVSRLSLAENVVSQTMKSPDCRRRRFGQNGASLVSFTIRDAGMA